MKVISNLFQSVNIKVYIYLTPRISRKIIGKITCFAKDYIKKDLEVNILIFIIPFIFEIIADFVNPLPHEVAPLILILAILISN